MTLDQKTLACVNLFGVFGAIPKLCALIPEAKEILGSKKASIGFDVKDAASATLSFENGNCRLAEGTDGCDILLKFPSAEKFNLMIDGKYTPIPRSGFAKIGFLTGAFTKLTDLLTKYLRPSDEDMKNEEFFKANTLLTLHVIRGAVAAIGNYDSVGKCSSSYIVDGVIKLSIKGSESVAISASGHKLTPIDEIPDKCMSCMEFSDLKLANDLFAGKVNAVACVGQGKVTISGMISQIDNVNRILDRVSLYLS